MHSLATVLCQIWGQFRWNLVLYGSKCPILKGSIKRPDLQTAYRYRAEIIQGRFQYDRAICSYKVWPYAGQSQLDAKIAYSWNFWPASETCRQATIKDMDFIFPVRTLRSLTCPPCKYEGMDMHSWSTVVCKIWGQFHWNLVIYGSKCPILKGVHQTPRSPNGL